MDNGVVVVLVFVVVAIFAYLGSRRFPAEAMRPMVYGDPGGFPTQHVYYPPWSKNATLDSRTAVQLCARDPMCSALTYTAAKQNQAQETPVIWPYTLDPDENTIFYRPADTTSGPSLYVKKAVDIAVPELIRPPR